MVIKRELGTLTYVRHEKELIDGAACWFSLWKFTPNDPESPFGGFPERYWCVSGDDMTPPTEPSDYDAKCSLCYLQGAHTRAYHRASLRRAAS
jgi:hypothetical protein